MISIFDSDLDVVIIILVMLWRVKEFEGESVSDLSFSVC